MFVPTAPVTLKPSSSPTSTLTGPASTEASSGNVYPPVMAMYQPVSVSAAVSTSSTCTGSSVIASAPVDDATEGVAAASHGPAAQSDVPVPAPTGAANTPKAKAANAADAICEKRVTRTSLWNEVAGQTCSFGRPDMLNNPQQPMGGAPANLRTESRQTSFAARGDNPSPAPDSARFSIDRA